MEITSEFIRYVEEGIPFSFSKYGDGEYMCVRGYSGSNCDGDTYEEGLRSGLRSSFKGIVEQGGFVGLWWDEGVKEYWEGMIEEKGKIKWVNYHAVIIDKEYESKIGLLKKIKESKYKKIYIHNYLLKKSKSLLNIDESIIIDIRNWFKYKESVKEEIKKHLSLTEKMIILTSMGMGAKIIIQELQKEFPDNIYIDIGSALDLICTKRDSRGKCPYEKHKEYFKELLPPDWDDPKYNYIYDEAKIKLGIHLN